MENHSRARLAALTGLRFVAALVVVLFHTEPRPLPAGLFGAIVGHGYVGVSAFFVLSGFILTYNYAADERPIDRRAFWAARFARVYPVYLLGIALALPHFVYSIGGTGPTAPIAAQSAVASLALVQAWAPSTACQLNCPGWSLSSEAFFYLAFPFVAAFLVRQPAWRSRAIALGAATAALAVPLAFWALDFAPESADAYGHLYNPAVRLPEFVLGMAAGRIFIRDLQPRLPRIARWSGLGAAAALAAVAAIALLADRPLVWRLTTGGGLAIPFALLVVSLAAGGGIVGRMLAAAPIVQLGEASYALYILHVPLASWWRTATRAAPELGTERLGGEIAYVVVAVICSVVVLRWFEQPMRRRLREAFARRVPVTVDSAT